MRSLCSIIDYAYLHGPPKVRSPQLDPSSLLFFSWGSVLSSFREVCKSAVASWPVEPQKRLCLLNFLEDCLMWGEYIPIMIDSSTRKQRKMEKKKSKRNLPAAHSIVSHAGCRLPGVLIIPRNYNNGMFNLSRNDWWQSQNWRNPAEW